MSIDLPTAYRNQIVRAVLGARPAMLAKEADTTALNRLAQRLAEDDQAMELLRAKGYGKRGMTLRDIVNALAEVAHRKSPT